ANGQAQSGGSSGPPSSAIQAQQGYGLNGAADSGESGTPGGAGEQGGAGAGNGSVDGVGEPTNRLATAGQMVEVPQKLSPGRGERPTDGTEDQVSSNPVAGSRTAAEAISAQPTSEVSAEQNLVPGEQRPVVRGYFR